MSISLGLLIVRVIVGLLLVGHGAQKLFGWFGGHGFAATTGMLKAKGFKPAVFWALLGGWGEFAGGLLLALGLLAPLGAIAIFASMFMAVFKFHWSKGLWGASGGYEYPLLLMILSIFLGLLGPGSYSLDALFGITLPTVPLFWLGFVASLIIDVVGIITSRQSAGLTEQKSAA